MQQRCEVGFSFVEFIMVATVVTFVTTGLHTFVVDRKPGPQPQMQLSLPGQARASADRMVRELEIAGNFPGNDANGPLAENSSTVARPFLVTEPDQVIFEADIEGNSWPERIEYRLKDATIERRVIVTNPDGSTFRSNYEVVTEYVDNGDLPLFRYSTDPNGELEGQGNIRSVWVTLQLRPPVLDPNRSQSRIIRFDGMAQVGPNPPGSLSPIFRTPF